jgi:hypothetical protein
MKRFLSWTMGLVTVLVLFSIAFAEDDTRQAYWRHIGTDTLSIGKAPGSFVYIHDDSLYIVIDYGTPINLMAGAGTLSGAGAEAGFIPYYLDATTLACSPFLMQGLNLCFTSPVGTVRQLTFKQEGYGDSVSMAFVHGMPGPFGYDPFLSITGDLVVSGNITSANSSSSLDLSGLADNYIPTYDGTTFQNSPIRTWATSTKQGVRVIGGMIGWPYFTMSPDPALSTDSLYITGDGSGNARIMPGVSTWHIDVDTYVRAQVISLASTNVDWNTGSAFTLDLTGSVTCTFSNLPSAYFQCITVKATNVGSGVYSVAWPATVKWTGGITPTHTAGAGISDIYTFIYYGSGSTVYGSVVQNM